VTLFGVFPVFTAIYILQNISFLPLFLCESILAVSWKFRCFSAFYWAVFSLFCFIHVHGMFTDLHEVFVNVCEYLKITLTNFTYFQEIRKPHFYKSHISGSITIKPRNNVHKTFTDPSPNLHKTFTMFTELHVKFMMFTVNSPWTWVFFTKFLANFDHVHKTFIFFTNQIFLSISGHIVNYGKRRWKLYTRGYRYIPH